MEESRSFCLIVLGKLSHQVDIDNSPAIQKRSLLSSPQKAGGDLAQSRGATPPPSRKVLNARELVEGTDIPDYTTLITRKSLHPKGGGTFSDVFREDLQCEGQLVSIAIDSVLPSNSPY